MVMRFLRKLFRKRPSRTARLYILRVDFPVDEKREAALEAMLAPLREKFGLDFLILEPGMKLERFDAI
jgi:hypothetical protein